MSAGLRRRVTDLACRALQAILPPSLQSWGWAVRCEAASIPDDTKALLFTLDSLCGLMPRAVASHLLYPFASLIGDGAPLSEGSSIMNIFHATMRRPRALGIASAIGAVVLGIVYMAIAGAPMRYLGINAGALVIGLTMLALLGRPVAAGQRWTGVAIIAIAGMLLATAFLGSEVEGAARWVKLGGLAIQPSLILLPVMLVAFCRTRSLPATAGIVAAAAAIALQPDRAMAGMLALCLATLAVIRRDRHVVVALTASVASFAATLAHADTLPAVPYVDQILYSSFNVHAGAGLAVLGGSALLLVPAIVGWSRDADNRATYAVFGAVWFAAIMAAALGNYPTPIVGYGGSAIIGYALSLLALPKLAGASTGVGFGTVGTTDRSPSDHHLLVALA
ncbi:hypothetical protein [Sphingomonas qomolangmaensis]|uniref:Cell wall polymerase n=1 Tax=Sphingomonas qomolangmaensis TaxID=2918765 RepID=A0ABY5L381_9SPHN|nr:hypothetical protein [Sphingomonas qomolangmaensis]UUL81252.1 hypothetical protein NMP03_08395 [Sphingomonas qomolangmaensis]